MPSYFSETEPRNQAIALKLALWPGRPPSQGVATSHFSARKASNIAAAIACRVYASDAMVTTMGRDR